MATSAVAGYKGKILLSSSTGGAVSAIIEIRNWSLSVEHAEIDATSHDSSGDREVIGGIGSWSASFDALHLQGAATHITLANAMLARTKVLAEFYPTGSSSDGWYDGEGFLTGMEISAPNEDAAASNWGFVGSGVIDLTTSS